MSERIPHSRELGLIDDAHSTTEKVTELLHRLKDNLDALLDLQVVAQQGSIRKAADRIHISQPALTRKLSRLEGVFQLPLLSRTPKGASLTPFGRAVVESARVIEAELVRVIAAARATEENVTGPFRVGITPLPPAYVIGSAINGLRQRYPRVSVKIIRGQRSSQRAKLLSGEIDLVIAMIPFGHADDGFIYEPIFEFSLGVIANARHPLAGQRNLTLSELVTHPWVLPARESGLYKLLREQFAQAGTQIPDCAMEVAGSIEDARAMLLATDMLAILPPESLEEELKEELLVELKGNWSFGTHVIGAYSHERSVRSDMIGLFLQYLKAPGR